jgi:hypothetical protein
MLPPTPTPHGDAPPPQLTFSPAGDVATPHFEWLNTIGLPNAPDLHFLAEEGSAWVMNDEKIWSQVHLPSLPFEEIRKIAYSPNGGLIAIVLTNATVSGPIKGMNIQI